MDGLRMLSCLLLPVLLVQHVDTQVCPEPPAIENAYLPEAMYTGVYNVPYVDPRQSNRKLYQAGKQFKYICKNGYIAEGDNNMTRCRASGRWSDANLNCIKLFHIAPVNQVGFFGDRMSVNCSPGVMYDKIGYARHGHFVSVNGEILEAERHRYTIENNASITINALEESDGTQYSCAFHFKKQAYKSFALITAVTPLECSALLNGNVTNTTVQPGEPGDNITIVCRIFYSGHLNPHVKWSCVDQNLTLPSDLCGAEVQSQVARNQTKQLRGLMESTFEMTVGTGQSFRVLAETFFEAPSPELATIREPNSQSRALNVPEFQDRWRSPLFRPGSDDKEEDFVDCQCHAFLYIMLGMIVTPLITFLIVAIPMVVYKCCPSLRKHYPFVQEYLPALLEYCVCFQVFKAELEIEKIGGDRAVKVQWKVAENCSDKISHYFAVHWRPGPVYRNELPQFTKVDNQKDHYIVEHLPLGVMHNFMVIAVSQNGFGYCSKIAPFELATINIIQPAEDTPEHL